MIAVNQYPEGTLVEASKTEGFDQFVTGTIDSQWFSSESYEQARIRTGKQYPEKSELLVTNTFLVKYYPDESDVPAYLVANYARIPEPVTTNAELFGLLTRIENILTETDPGKVMRSVASLITDKEDMLVRLNVIRDRLKV